MYMSSRTCISQQGHAWISWYFHQLEVNQYNHIINRWPHQWHRWFLVLIRKSANPSAVSPLPPVENNFELFDWALVVRFEFCDEIITHFGRKRTPAHYLHKWRPCHRFWTLSTQATPRFLQMGTSTLFFIASFHFLSCWYCWSSKMTIQDNLNFYKALHSHQSHQTPSNFTSKVKGILTVFLSHLFVRGGHKKDTNLIELIVHGFKLVNDHTLRNIEIRKQMMLKDTLARTPSQSSSSPVHSPRKNTATNLSKNRLTRD